MNRVIVVTGGAGGIGRCIVEYFASQGDKVYFVDCDREAMLVEVEKCVGKGKMWRDFPVTFPRRKCWRNLRIGCFGNSRKVSTV